MLLCIALISFAAAASFVLVALGIAFVESRESKTKGTVQMLRSDPWKPLLGGFCAAAVAGASTAEFVVPDFRKPQNSPLLRRSLANQFPAVAGSDHGHRSFW